MSGIIARKVQMTQLAKGDTMIPVTVLRVPKLVVKQLKTLNKDGYNAVVLSIIEKDKEVLTREVTPFSTEVKVGDEITFDVFEGLEEVTMTGVSKGKGFTGAMKRWNFKGGPAGHGSKFHRALGSIGTRKPRRTKPGKKMHGRHGNKTTTLKSVPIELVDADLRVIALRGAVPGARNSFVSIQF